MKYISLLHLSGVTLSLARRIYQEGPHFSVSRGLPPPLVQTQLFQNESNSSSILSHLVKHRWNMTASTAQSMAVYSIPSWAQRLESVPLKIKLRSPQSEQRVQFWGRVRKKKKNNFFPHLMYKKNKQLSVCVLSGYEQRRSPSTTVTTGPWSFRGVCKNTHTAARLRLRRPSGGSLWPSLSLCKNQCSPMMCYVKFPEAWFKWLDILHASLVILQCIAPKSTWTLHEKQM